MVHEVLTPMFFFFFSHRHTWRGYAEAHVTWHMSCQHWSITYLVKSQISTLCRNHISFLILNIILKHYHICWKLLHLDNVLWNLIELKTQTSWLANTYKLPGTEWLFVLPAVHKNIIPFMVPRCLYLSIESVIKLSYYHLSISRLKNIEVY